MELLSRFADVFLHLDDHMSQVIQQYGPYTYAILFVIVFAETGLVVTPFLPGDSLLFATGAFAATGALDLATACLVLTAAAILGDTVNYAIGRRIGPRVFGTERIRFLKREHLDRTQSFYERYGAKTIVLARFVPIVRTFAPFVAGVGSMAYGRFVTYNVVGALLWVMGCTLAGYFFGNLPIVKDNFTLVILAIVFVSILPGVFEYVRHRREKAITPGAGRGGVAQA